MEIFILVQLGFHLFSLFELMFIIGRSYPKYYESMLHHCITVTLIVFSTMSNWVTVGITIMVVHDTSSVFSSGGRAYL